MTPEEFNKICKEYDSAPDDFGWDEGHPIFRLAQESDSLKKVIQMCFDDACKPSGMISKKTAIELMKFADTRA